MPAAVDAQIKKQVIREWLTGNSRDRIASDNHIGEGTVSNIIGECKRTLDDGEYNSARELAIFSKKQGLNLSELASRFRLFNYVKQLNANEHQIESLIANLLDGAKSLSPEQVIHLTNQLFEISKDESVALAEVPKYIEHEIQEKRTLVLKIQEMSAILRRKNVNVQTAEEHKRLEEELMKNGFSMKDIRILLRVLTSITQLGHDSRKIISELARLKSLRRTERNLKNKCEILESRAARYKEILPLCEQLVRFGIGFNELFALHVAIMKMADSDNLPFGTAAYVLMDGIDTTNKLANMKRHLTELWMRIRIMNLVSGCQNDAMIALAKLEFYGVKEDQILKICRCRSE